MEAEIRQLIDKQENKEIPVYPKTHEKAVVLLDGTRLDVLLDDILRRLTALEGKSGITNANVLRNTKGVAANIASIIDVEKENETITSDDIFDIDGNEYVPLVDNNTETPSKSSSN